MLRQNSGLDFKLIGRFCEIFEDVVAESCSSYCVLGILRGENAYIKRGRMQRWVEFNIAVSVSAAFRICCFVEEKSRRKGAHLFVGEDFKAPLGEEGWSDSV